MAAKRAIPAKKAPKSARGGGGPQQKPFADFGPAPGDLVGPNGLGVGEMFAPAMDPAEKIATAIGAALDKGPVGRIRLTQKVAGGEQPVAEFEGEEIEGQDPDSIAQAIYLRALEDVDGSGGLSRFVALIYRPGGTTPVARTWFRLAAEDLDSVAETEDPSTSAGMMSAAWRHTEAFAKLALNTAVESQRMMSRELLRVTEQNERFEQRHVEMIVAREALADRKAVRDLAVDAGRARLARAEKHKSLAETAVVWGMGLAAAKFGIPLPPSIAAAMAAPQLGTGGGGGQQQPQPTTFHLSGDQVKALGRVALAVLDQLVRLPRAMLDVVLARMTAEDRKIIIEVVEDAASTSTEGEESAPAIDARRLAAYQGVICGVLAGLAVDPATVDALIAQLVPEVQQDARALRAALTTPKAAE